MLAIGIKLIDDVIAIVVGVGGKDYDGRSLGSKDADQQIACYFYVLQMKHVAIHLSLVQLKS